MWDIQSVLMRHPNYPYRSRVEGVLGLFTQSIAGDDLELIQSTREQLLAEVALMVGYTEKAAAKLAQKKAEEEAARLAATEQEKATFSLSALQSLVPMDKVLVVSQATNVRNAPAILAARVGRIAKGETLTALGQVKDQDWYFVEYGDGDRGFVYSPILSSKDKQVGTAAKDKPKPKSSINYGRYYALVIGNNNYRHLPRLQSAVNDAEAVSELLSSSYGFKVETLLNATRSDTFSSLSRVRKQVGENDNLLIYYAGHGWLDKDAGEGYWMPVDAGEDDSGNWISSADIIASVKRTKAKHVMVVADSCFSGTLTRGLSIKTRTPDYIKQIAAKKSRTALTSGGLEPVMDGGGASGDHSVFADAFLRILQENESVLDGHKFFSSLKSRVMVNSEQTPEYGDIRKAGHDGGDFLFVRQ